MKPYIIIFSKDQADKALDFAGGAVFLCPEREIYCHRALDRNVPLLDGDILIRFESLENPNHSECYLVGKENFSILEGETFSC